MRNSRPPANSYNTAVGFQALHGSGTINSNTGITNTAVGYRTMYNYTSGNANSSLGYRTLFTNTTGNNNVAVGYGALEFSTTGSQNTAVGRSTLVSVTTADNNTAIGYDALRGSTNITGSNTAVGASAYSSSNNFSNSAGFGFDAEPTASNYIRVGNASVTDIGGQVGWTTISDGRFKLNVQENVPGLDLIKKLRPVTYTWDMDALAEFEGTPEENRLKESEAAKAKVIESGFIAQEVAEAAEELGYDFNGVRMPANDKDPYALRYANFVTPMVKAIQEQQKQIEEGQQVQKEQLKMIKQQNELLSQLMDRIDAQDKELASLKNDNSKNLVKAQKKAARQAKLLARQAKKDAKLLSKRSRKQDNTTAQIAAAAVK